MPPQQTDSSEPVIHAYQLYLSSPTHLKEQVYEGQFSSSFSSLLILLSAIFNKIIKQQSNQIPLQIIMLFNFSLPFSQYKFSFQQKSLTYPQMFAYLLLALIAITAYLVFKWILKPLGLMSFYTKNFRSHGFTVAKLPLRPLSSSYYDMVYGAVKTKNDAYYHHKHQYYATDVLVCNLLNKPQLVLINYELIKEVMTPEKVSILPKDISTYGIFFSNFKQGLIGIEGNTWKHRRKLLTNIFNYDFITSQIPMMTDIADRVFTQFQNKCGKKGKQLNVEIFQMMIKYTSSVVMAGFVGLDSMKEQLRGKTIGELIIQLCDMGITGMKDPLLLILGEHFINRGYRQFDRDMVQLRADVNRILKEYVLKYEEELGKESHKSDREMTIIQLLIRQRSLIQKSQQPIKLSDEDLIDQIKTFVVGGSQTTSNFLTAMLLHIFQKPKVVEKLKREINQVVKTDLDMTVDNLKKLKYLDCIISETSRMFNSTTGLLMRQTTEDTTIGGVPIKKGTLIECNWLSFLHNPQIFKDPLDFNPQRWLEQNTKDQHFASLIFSGSPRSCIGKHLALLEMKVMMVKFMKRYESVVGAKRQDWIYELKLTYHIKDSEVTVVKAEAV